MHAKEQKNPKQYEYPAVNFFLFLHILLIELTTKDTEKKNMMEILKPKIGLIFTGSKGIIKTFIIQRINEQKKRNL